MGECGERPFLVPALVRSLRGERGAGRGASGNKERLTTRRDRREARRHDHHERKRNYLSFSLPISFLLSFLSFVSRLCNALCAIMYIKIAHQGAIK
jgi:hypothetical protein